MIGRAARGRPWVFKEILHLLEKDMAWSIQSDMFLRTVVDHIDSIHRFYGPRQGVRIARKHIGWYLKGLPGFEAIRREVLRTEDTTRQIRLVKAFLAESRANSPKEKTA
jgi:tRNA-dihydrouridine synthase B